MEALARHLEAGALAGWPRLWVFALVIAAYALAVFTFFSLVAGILSWVERRIAARMQSRIGPNRVGPQGFFQWAADGLKTLLKEDLIPANADALLFRVAPYFVFTGTFLTLVAVPFSSRIIGADLNVGLLFVIAITSLVVVGLLMAGWASNNKWSIIGGMRSAAQIVSYEIPSALALLVPVMLAGSLSTQQIIARQGALDWFLFHDPFTFVAFWVFLIAATAEGNRAPFDMPEAESELVAGYNTEYSGMRFLFFFFAEWGNLFVIGAIATVAWLGGWKVPFVAADAWFRLPLEVLFFLAKSFVWVFVLIWVRWTLPRLRVDQLMALCWKYLIPIALVNVMGAALWMVATGNRSLVDLVVATLGWARG